MIVQKGNNLCTSKLRLLCTINRVILRYKKHQKTVKPLSELTLNSRHAYRWAAMPEAEREALVASIPD